jgi:hypothetical protein
MMSLQVTYYIRLSLLKQSFSCFIKGDFVIVGDLLFGIDTVQLHGCEMNRMKNTRRF